MDGGANPFTNAALIQFGACTAGSDALTHFAVVDTSSGAVSMMISGALSGTLNVSSGIQPQFANRRIEYQRDLMIYVATCPVCGVHAGRRQSAACLLRLQGAYVLVPEVVETPADGA